ncbi:MAG: T9SS type A sorting domain-containing protein [Chitinophagaceae bacterium]|nr:T9SS type A sorting domain-containing protein [Chitinophagaceae bacterium]
MIRLITLCLVAFMATSALNTYAQVPKLNSYPTATATIFLDFDGQTVSSPYWNAGNSFYATPPVLTNAQITTIFNQVAEDFRPFNLNITTDSAVYFATIATKRQRIIITSYSSWYGSAGGVAYLESFRWGLEVPGFVFSNLLGHNPKNVAEASSHESGHTLGLNHQTRYDANCNYLNDYHPGTGVSNSEIGWAPIMGNSYSKNLSLWHNGTSVNGCNTMQNDLTVIASSANGFGYRTDDVGNTTNQSSNVIFNGQTYAVNGFVNSTNDVDVFRVSVPERGRFTMSAVPSSVPGAAGFSTSNIDIQVSLLASNGNVINTYNPTTSVQSVIDSILDPGTYFLRVTNISNMNVANYGMLGNYAMSGAFVPNSTLPVYSLVLNGTVDQNKHDLNWSIVADEPIESITLETSADGKTFTDLQEVNGTSRKFVYQPYEKGTLYYRLHVVTASGLKYYSNIISLRETATELKYSLLTNFIQSSSVVVNSNGNYNWRLVDMNGRSIANGKVNTGVNRINTNHLTNGMYLLQIIDGAEISTEKIVIQ